MSPPNNYGDWQSVTLGDLVTIVRGRSYRSVHLQENTDTALVTLKSFQRGGGYRYDGLKPYVGPYNDDQVVHPGEIIVAQTDITQNGDVVGRPAIVSQHSNYPNLVASLDAAIVRNAASELLDLKFLYYRLMARDYAHHAKSMATGTTVLHLSRDAVPLFNFMLPPLPEQRRIAHILGALDDKIELNRRMNATLEQMARALFKSWFIDFDPVRAKMSGRWRRGKSLPGLPAHLYDLFPSRLVPSEIGEAPEGWGVKALGELIELAYGKALKSDDRQGGNIPVYGSNGQVGWHDEKLVSGPGIVVGRKGKPGAVAWTQSDFFPIDTTFYVVPSNENQSLHFLFYALTNQGLPSIAADSAVPGLNRNMAYMNKQLVPGKVIMDEFSSYANTIFTQRHHLEEASRTLADLRDIMLPKLVSGEVRVCNSEKSIGNIL